MLTPLLAATLAFAQAGPPQMDAQLFRPSIDSRHSLWADDGSMAPLGTSMARVNVHWFQGSLGVVRNSGEELHGIDNALALDLGGAVYLDFVRIGVHVPVYGLVTSDVWDWGRGLGDIGIDTKFVFLNPDDTGIGLGASFRGTAPTSTMKSLPLGSDGFTWEAALIGDLRVGPVAVAVNLGTRGLPPVQVANLDFSDRFVFRSAVGFDISDDAGVTVDLAGLAAYKGSDPASFPMEGLVGGWTRITDSFVLRGGVGMGLSSGVGASSGRAMMAVSFEAPVWLDSDADGIEDDLDPCPLSPEDVDGFEDGDGCPDDDNDSDGVVDSVDQCPDQAEDFDEIADGDGCPEPSTWLTVAASLGPDRPLDGAQITLSSGDVVIDVPFREPTVVEPGDWVLTVSAEHLSTHTADVQISANESVGLDVLMAAGEGYRLVSIAITDGGEQPLQAEWTLKELGLSFDTAPGRNIVPVPIGTHTVSVNSFGFVQEDTKLDVLVDGPDPTMTMVMHPAWGAVLLKLVDPDGNPLPGTWYYQGDQDLPPIEMPSEGLDNFMQEGDHVVMVRSEGYKDAFVPLRVLRDVITEISWAMEPGTLSELEDGGEEELENAETNLELDGIQEIPSTPTPAVEPAP